LELSDDAMVDMIDPVSPLKDNWSKTGYSVYDTIAASISGGGEAQSDALVVEPGCATHSV